MKTNKYSRVHDCTSSCFICSVEFSPPFLTDVLRLSTLFVSARERIHTMQLQSSSLSFVVGCWVLFSTLLLLLLWLLLFYLCILLFMNIFLTLLLGWDFHVDIRWMQLSLHDALTTHTDQDTFRKSHLYVQTTPPASLRLGSHFTNWWHAPTDGCAPNTNAYECKKLFFMR